MMNRGNNPIEDELNAIRTENYEYTKNMTPAERVTYVNESAEQILKPYGIKPVTMNIIRSSPLPEKSVQ